MESKVSRIQESAAEEQQNLGHWDDGSTDLSTIREPIRMGFLGQTLNKLELKDFTFTEATYAPGTSIPPHLHDNAGFCLTLAGHGVEMNSKVVEHTRPGTLLIRPAGQVHSDRIGPTGARSFITEVSPAWLKAFADFSRIFDDARTLHGGLIPSLAMRICQEARIKDSAAPIVVEGMMLELLGSTSRWLLKPPVRVPTWLIQARDLLHSNFHDSLNLVAIAEAVGVHPTHLARAFKQHYSSTVGHYIRKLRLDWASKQLSEGKDSVTEIAVGAGFYDQSHFINTFKKFTGQTPAEFRASFARQASKASYERAEDFRA